jgi:hypothetical protein
LAHVFRANEVALNIPYLNDKIDWYEQAVRKADADARIKRELTFRAIGITAYLKNGGKLEIAQQVAAHESSCTTGLYDRRDNDVNLDEVERMI